MGVGIGREVLQILGAVSAARADLERGNSGAAVCRMPELAQSARDRVSSALCNRLGDHSLVRASLSFATDASDYVSWTLRCSMDQRLAMARRRARVREMVPGLLLHRADPGAQARICQYARRLV